MAKQDEQIKRELIEALEKTLGVVTTACKQVNISRGKYYKLLNGDAEFKKAVDEINNVSLDFVESQLFKQIKDGNTAATIFYLKCKGKYRGYVERQEIEVSGGSLHFDKEDEAL